MAARVSSTRSNASGSPGASRASRASSGAETAEFPSGYIIEGHAQLVKWGVGGSYGIEGSRGCMRSCFNHLEKQGRIEQTFAGGEFIRRPRWQLPSKVEPARKGDPV